MSEMPSRARGRFAGWQAPIPDLPAAAPEFSMLSCPSHARITLALDIVRKLDEGPYRGYHELGIIKHQVELHDTIAVEPSGRMEIVCDVPSVPRDASNVCWRAAQALALHSGTNERVRIHIEKRLPVMGGLAGGSSNAATTLMLCNDLWKLGLDAKTLTSIARDVGMDVPYFLSGGTCFDSEATAVLRPIPTSLILDFVVVLPGFGVSTRDAYRSIDYAAVGRRRDATAAMEAALYAGDREGVLCSMHNDFEVSVFPAHPRLAEIKQQLLDAGCAASAMSGSGSTVVGVARDRAHAQAVAATLPFETLVTSTRLSREVAP